MERISPWWDRARYADRRPFLQARNAVTRALRAWFDEQGFVEVETGVLQVSPGNETHLHAPRTSLTTPAGERATRIGHLVKSDGEAKVRYKGALKL